MAMVIRPAAPADAPEIVRLNAAYDDLRATSMLGGSEQSLSADFESGLNRLRG